MTKAVPPNGSRFSCGRPAYLRVSIRRPTRVNHLAAAAGRATPHGNQSGRPSELAPGKWTHRLGLSWPTRCPMPEKKRLEFDVPSLRSSNETRCDS